MDVLANLPLLLTIAAGLGTGAAVFLVAKRDTTVKILTQNNAALRESVTILEEANRQKDERIKALTEQNTKLATGVAGQLKQLTQAVNTGKDGNGVG